MKTNEKKALQDKTVDELQAQMIEAKKVLFTLKLDASQRKLKNTSLLRLKRQDIARLLSMINRKETV